ncbi:MAG: Hsp20/alpha crystallin family protein [Planctomycetota bacterium]|nr:MAG: Hsp20/alpha crystallin family protein [Planctomycetota bacterium]
MFTTYWAPLSSASSNGIRRDLQEAFNQVYQGKTRATTQIPLTVWEDDRHIYLELDVPGFSNDAVDVRFQNGQLTISGERPLPKNDARCHLNERMFGSFSRTVNLPEMVDPSSIEAELQNGVLQVVIQKRPEAQPLKIQVKGAAGREESKRISHEE